MKSSNNKTLILFLCGILSLSLFSCKQKKDVPVIKVACNMPISGGLKFYGEYLQNGVNMAMTELKDSMDKYRFFIDYDFQDNFSTENGADEALDFQLAKGFDIYLSGVTNQTVMILDRVKATKKPHFIISFDPFFINKGDNLYRPYLDMEKEGQCMMEYMKQKEPKTVAFVYQNITSTNVQFGQILEPFAKENGFQVVLDERYDVSLTDFKNLVLKVKKANPDLIFVYGFQDQLAEIIKGFNLHQIKKDGNVVCSFDFLDVQTVLPQEMLDGIVTFVPHSVVTDTGRIAQWKETFKTIYSRAPLFTEAYAYDMAYSIYYAVKKQLANPNLSFEDCLLAIEFDGATGHVKYLENRQMEYNVHPCIFKDGEFRFLSQE